MNCVKNLYTGAVSWADSASQSELQSAGKAIRGQEDKGGKSKVCKVVTIVIEELEEAEGGKTGRAESAEFKDVFRPCKS